MRPEPAPVLWSTPGQRGPGAACSGLAHLLAQQTTCTHSPGSGCNLLYCCRRGRALGRPPGLLGAYSSQSREQQKWRCDPGRQEVLASQPLHSPGPQRTMELPGKNPAWTLGCLASLWSLKLMLRVQSLCFLRVRGKAVGQGHAPQRGHISVVMQCRLRSCQPALGPHILLQGCPCHANRTQVQVSQLSAVVAVYSPSSQQW